MAKSRRYDLANKHASVKSRKAIKRYMNSQRAGISSLHADYGQ